MATAKRSEATNSRSRRAAMMRTQGFISVRESSERCALSVGALYKWIAEGSVKSTRVGNAVYIELASLRAQVGPEVTRAAGL